MAVGASAERPKREMKVLAMGLPRTGTASMAQALTILGYADVYHGFRAIDNPEDWSFLGRAADATFPSLPTYTGKPFSHDDWEALYGPCEASTDVASLFGRHLIEAYPNAKVILVDRDFDKWAKSMEIIFDSLWGVACSFIIAYVEPLIGTFASSVNRKLFLGFCQAGSKDEAMGNLRAARDRHHQEVREATRPGQLLEYTIGDGWEPLCNFLGKPVPDVEFPWFNDAAAFEAKIKESMRENLIKAAIKIAPWVVGVGAVATASWMWIFKAQLKHTDCLGSV